MYREWRFVIKKTFYEYAISSIDELRAHCIINIKNRVLIDKVIYMNITPEVKELAAQHVACVSFIGDYRGKAEIFGDLFAKLGAWAGPKGLFNEDTRMISAYNNDPQTTLPEELSLDVCVTVPEDVTGEGEIKTKILPGGTYVVASVELTGPEQYEESWAALVAWLVDNEFEMDTDGTRPWYEIYKNNPQDHPEGHHILDMCAAVK
jgi:AraC family transcriptional regulator